MTADWEGLTFELWKSTGTFILKGNTMPEGGLVTTGGYSATKSDCLVEFFHKARGLVQPSCRKTPVTKPPHQPS